MEATGGKRVELGLGTTPFSATDLAVVEEVVVVVNLGLVSERILLKAEESLGFWGLRREEEAEED